MRVFVAGVAGAIGQRLVTQLVAAGHVVLATTRSQAKNSRAAGRITTEQDPLDGASPDAQHQTLSAIRYLERAVTHAPLHGVVLRYGLLYGPGASEKFADMVRARKFPLVGAGSGSGRSPT